MELLLGVGDVGVYVDDETWVDDDSGDADEVYVDDDNDDDDDIGADDVGVVDTDVYVDEVPFTAS